MWNKMPTSCIVYFTFCNINVLMPAVCCCIGSTLLRDFIGNYAVCLNAVKPGYSSGDCVSYSGLSTWYSSDTARSAENPFSVMI
jgi:hypothetical protein